MMHGKISMATANVKFLRHISDFRSSSVVRLSRPYLQVSRSTVFDNTVPLHDLRCEFVTEDLFIDANVSDSDRASQLAPLLRARDKLECSSPGNFSAENCSDDSQIGVNTSPQEECEFSIDLIWLSSLVLRCEVLSLVFAKGFASAFIVQVHDYDV
mmetsp:Transcript_1618/g.3374  ORF Transcript_1618/g.3374 Transcript_1618/m.3374 type:complete len:156 (-) Transcript_1618:68-535(-)